MRRTPLEIGADRLAFAVLGLVERRVIESRTPACDALEAYALTRWGGPNHVDRLIEERDADAALASPPEPQGEDADALVAGIRQRALDLNAVRFTLEQNEKLLDDLANRLARLRSQPATGEGEAWRAACAEIGIVGIYDEFHDAADAIRQLGQYIREAEEACGPCEWEGSSLAGRIQALRARVLAAPGCYHADVLAALVPPAPTQREASEPDKSLPTELDNVGKPTQREETLCPNGCVTSDRWRCAKATEQPTIACHCACHDGVPAPEAQESEKGSTS